MVSRMARIVHMGKLGGYAALLEGTLLELDGRLLWPSTGALSEAMRRAGIQPSDLILDTRSPTVAMTSATVNGSAAGRLRSGALAMAA